MDFLIKNTKGLTLKTKGKYCTEDLVIEIDPSLVEGYMEVDELPEVGLPRVLYKLMLEEPEYYIWENDEWVQLNTKGGGGLIEVTELPEVGEEDVVYKLVSGPTVVPNTGYVEKVYFNTSKDYESYYNLFEKIDFVEFQGTLGYPILLTEDNKILFFGKVVDDEGVVDHYSLSYLDLVAMDSITNIIVYTKNSEMWNDDFITSGSYIDINTNVVSSMQGISIGAQNDLLKDFVSSTPSFETSTEYFTYTESRIEIVPNSGHVEKVYFNIDLSENDIHSLIDTLTLYTTPFFNFPVYPLLFSSDFNFGIILSVVDDDLYGKIYIIAYANAITNETTYLYYKITNSELEYTPLTTKELVVNKEVIAEYSGLPIGTENDKLINLIRTTPFVESGWKQISGGFKNVDALPNTGNENYTYILKNDNYEIYLKIETMGILNFVEYIRQNGGSSELVGVFDNKDQLPTSNIKVSNIIEQLYFYYVKNNDIYLYGAFGGDNNNAWFSMSDLMYPFGGEITSTNQITNTETMYVLKSEGVEKYYRYTYIFELNMYQVNNGEIYDFTEIAKEQGLKVNAEAVTSLPSEPIESDLSTTFYVYYLKGDNAYVYNQNILGGWGTVSTVLDIPYNGEVSSLDEMTTNGLYVLYNDGYYYKELSKIPEGYIMPSGTLDITNNGNIDVTNYAYVNVNISAQPVLQQKTIDPIKSSQDITPDSGYDGLSKVTIRAIPDNYIIPSGTITVDSYSGPVSFDVTNYKELDLNLSLYENEVELLGNKLTCISNKADEYTYIKIITYDAQTDIYYDMFFDIKDAGTIIKTIQDDLEIRLISQSTHNSLKVGSSSGGSEYAVLTKNGSNNKFSMNVSEDITIYLTYE